MRSRLHSDRVADAVSEISPGWQDLSPVRAGLRLSIIITLMVASLLIVPVRTTRYQCGGSAPRRCENLRT
jgi:hypothetical protein